MCFDFSDYVCYDRSPYQKQTLKKSYSKTLIILQSGSLWPQQQEAATAYITMQQKFGLLLTVVSLVAQLMLTCTHFALVYLSKMAKNVDISCEFAISRVDRMLIFHMSLPFHGLIEC